MTEAPPIGAFRSCRERGALSRQRCGWLTGKISYIHPGRKVRTGHAGERRMRRAAVRPAAGPSGPARFSGRPVR